MVVYAQKKSPPLRSETLQGTERLFDLEGTSESDNRQDRCTRKVGWGFLGG